MKEKTELAIDYDKISFHENDQIDLKKKSIPFQSMTDKGIRFVAQKYGCKYWMWHRVKVYRFDGVKRLETKNSNSIFSRIGDLLYCSLNSSECYLIPKSAIGSTDNLRYY